MFWSQVLVNSGWSTSASTSASPATSVCLCVSTTCQSDSVILCLLPDRDQGNKSRLFHFPLLPFLLLRSKENKTNKSRLSAFPPRRTVGRQTPRSVCVLPRKRRRRRAVDGFRQIPVVTPGTYDTLSGNTLRRSHKYQSPLFSFFLNTSSAVFFPAAARLLSRRQRFQFSPKTHDGEIQQRVVSKIFSSQHLCVSLVKSSIFPRLTELICDDTREYCSILLKIQVIITCFV